MIGDLDWGISASCGGEIRLTMDESTEHVGSDGMLCKQRSGRKGTYLSENVLRLLSDHTESIPAGERK